MRHPFLRSAGSELKDPNFENVTLLLHGDGTNGGQNNTFVDGSNNNFAITRSGNTTQGTFSPYGDNWSNYFDGISDSLTTPYTPASLDWWTSDFTIEAWVYAASWSTWSGIVSGNNRPSLVGNMATLGITNYWSFGPTTTGNLVWYYYNGADTSITSSATIRTSEWNHIAATKTSSGITFFINGVAETPIAISGTPTSSNSQPLAIGSHRNISISGYVSNLRIIKGTALYTATFTPPTAPLTAITNTSLLTCQSNRFRDASTNNFTITRNGDVSVQRFSPFSPTAAYASGTIGGSGYFDGTGDYLSYGTGNVLLGSSDFTAEAFVYLTATNGNNPSAVFYGQGDGSSAAGSSYAFFLRSATNSELYIGSSAYGIASPVTSIGQWQHVAWVRSGGTFSVFTNGTRTATRADLGTLAVNTGSTSRNPNIGCTDNNGNFPFAGYIASARIIVGSGGYDATQTSITVPTTPLTAITNTSLLLNFTNAAILDNAMMAVPETVGNAQIDTTTKKFGTGSLEFDGTGDYLVVNSTTDLYAFGSGAFTIEFWLYLNSTQTSNLIDFRPSGTEGAYPTIFVQSNVLKYYTSTGDRIIGSTLSNSVWYHIALCKSGTSTKLFIDGTQTGSTYTDTATYLGSAGRPYIGGSSRNVNTNIVNGYIDDLRITKGVARYTANFTAPTAPFPNL